MNTGLGYCGLLMWTGFDFFYRIGTFSMRVFVSNLNVNAHFYRQMLAALKEIKFLDVDCIYQLIM